MCWRDNERDYRGEAARSRLNADRLERERKGKAFALKATKAEKRASYRVDLLHALLQVVLMSDYSGRDNLMFTSEDFHKYFLVFAKALGIRGALYEMKEDRCVAVDISARMDGYEPNTPTISFIRPKSSKEKAFENVHSIAVDAEIRASDEKLLRAARLFLQAAEVEKEKAPAQN